MKIIKFWFVALLITTSLSIKAQSAGIDIKYQGEASICGLFCEKIGLSVQTIHGIKVGQYLFLGGGIEASVNADDFKESSIAPIASFKGYYPIRNDMRAFLGPNFGVDFCLDSNDRRYFKWQVIAGIEKGLFQVGLGAAEYRGEASFLVKLGVVF